MSSPTGPSGPTDPTPTLANALAALERAAADAGVSSDQARVEGELLAATIAEPSRGAFLDWGEQLGGNRSSEDFFAAAQKGRKWRAAPTALLSELVVNGSTHAKAYGDALAEVCHAATGLGEHSMRTVGNATMAAAAQQRSVLPPDPEPAAPLDAEPAAPESSLPAPETLLRFLQQVNTEQLRSQTARIRDLGSSFLFGRKDDESGESSSAAPAGNPFDLGALDPHAPGAFSGLPTSGGPLGFGQAPGAPSTPSSHAPSAPSSDSTSAPSSDSTSAPSATGTAENSNPTAAAAPAPTATATADGTPAPAEPAEDPRTVEELLAELDELIGLDRVKREIHRQVAVLKVEQLRNKAGLKSPTITRHLIFTGNPGTGKTTVARLVAGIYRALGLISKGQLVEVDRSELVAGYLGQTAIKTAEVVASAAGGVLFIDEAYALSSSDDQYGQEAVDTLVKEMEDRRDDLVVIVAGYTEPMKKFIDQNPGLASRFRTEIGFEDYTDDELVAIFRSMATQADYDITDRCEKRFRMILQITPRGSTFGNGRFARNCMEAAIGRHAWRLRDVADPSLAELREIMPEDLDEHDGDDDGSPTDQSTAAQPADNPLTVTEANAGPDTEPDTGAGPDLGPDPEAGPDPDTTNQPETDGDTTWSAESDEEDPQPATSAAETGLPWWASEQDQDWSTEPSPELPPVTTTPGPTDPEGSPS